MSKINLSDKSITIKELIHLMAKFIAFRKEDMFANMDSLEMIAGEDREVYLDLIAADFLDGIMKDKFKEELGNATDKQVIYILSEEIKQSKK